jgi:3'(2'), 5'-bisphosphate nucleotidase
MIPSAIPLEPLVSLAQRAGEAILQVYGPSLGDPAHGDPTRADPGVTWKEDRTPLTQADRASHRVILEGLRELTPEIPVISEEGDAGEWGEIPPDALHWMVDPLDGTKEFLKRTGEFTVNIALIRDGSPVAGVVHAPVLERSWIGGADGAEVRGREGRERLTVRSAIPERLGVVASRDHAGPRVTALLASLSGPETLSMGSSLKFCLIAEGRADLYLRDGPTMEWDTGAAQAVLEAAGGGVYTLDGRPLRYGKKDRRNPHFVAVGDPALDWRAIVDDGREGI